MLGGEITLKIGDEVTVGGPGTCAFMLRGVPHEGAGAWKPGRPAQVFLEKWMSVVSAAERTRCHQEGQPMLQGATTHLIRFVIQRATTGSPINGFVAGQNALIRNMLCTPPRRLKG
jgi:hypothetical protein